MNEGRRATSSAALLVYIVWVVLELVVEADAVHLLEHVEAIGFEDDRSVATAAHSRFGHCDILSHAIRVGHERQESRHVGCGFRTGSRYRFGVQLHRRRRSHQGASGSRKLVANSATPVAELKPTLARRATTHAGCARSACMSGSRKRSSDSVVSTLSVPCIHERATTRKKMSR
jgi:hypothetical protein